MVKFDKAKIDYGSVTNSGSSPQVVDNQLIITFDAVIIANSQTDGQLMNFDAHVTFDEITVQSVSVQLTYDLTTPGVRI